MKLAGMFFTRDDDDRFCTGEIVAEVAPEAYMIKVDTDAAVPANLAPMELVHIADMLLTDSQGWRRWVFFKSRAELDAWIAWLEAPSTPRVVNLVKK